MMREKRLGSEPLCLLLLVCYASPNKMHPASSKAGVTELEIQSCMWRGGLRAVISSLALPLRLL